MKIAVIGCLHGELDTVYEKILKQEESQQIVIDLVLVCGDFQTVRNKNDLKCMAVPVKYQRLGTFHQYYSGEKIAPKLTLLIGGNHEASNYLQTLPYGGWVAPNMYYLGYSSVIRFKGLRIGGVSGIFKMHDAKFGHFERLPYDNSTMRSIYHMREVEIYKLLQISNRQFNNNNSNEKVNENTKNENFAQNVLDIFMSHDWPVNIHSCGNVNYLLKVKPYFRDEVNSGRLGNPLLQPLVHHLRPKHWFAAHLHVGFNATVVHQKLEPVDPSTNNPSSNSEVKTQFQALDKVLPRRHFLHVVDIPEDNEKSEQKDNFLEYDPEWLSVLKKTDHLLKIERQHVQGIDIFNCANEIQITYEDIKEISDLFDNNFTISNNFQRSEPVLDIDTDPNRQKNYTNPQTTQFCKILGIRDPNELIIQSTNQTDSKYNNEKVTNPDAIDLTDESDCEGDDDLTTKKIKLDDVFFIDTKGEN